MKLISYLMLATSLTATALCVFAQDAKPAAASAPMAAKAEPAKVAKPDLAKGEAGFTAVCSACHGADGNSAIPANPKLAQQQPQYVLKQLQDFKAKRRTNDAGNMTAVLRTISDEDLKALAAYVASLD